MNMLLRFIIVAPIAIGAEFHAFGQNEPAAPSIQVVDPPALRGAMAPRLTSLGSDRALLSWLEPAPDAEPSNGAPVKRTLRLRFSQFDGEQWSEPRSIVQRDDFFANWADVPSITRNTDGSLLAHWLQKSGESAYAYDIMLARSSDEGVTWKTLGKLNDDDVQTEHGFVSLVREGDGIRAFWLDGRDMKSEAHGSDAEAHGSGNMTLRAAVIRGETISRSEVLDVRVCECCNTCGALAAGGPIIAYRDRSEQDTRDIAVVRRVNGAWTDPRIVHGDDWQISACPVNGPAIAAHENTAVVAWFTAAQQHPRVRLAFSTDGGATFDKPVEIDDADPLGRVAVAMDPSGAAIVCWFASEHGQAEIRAALVRPDGPRGRPIAIGTTSAARSSGFPTIAVVNKRLLVVWTDGGRPSTLRAVLSDPPN